MLHVSSPPSRPPVPARRHRHSSTTSYGPRFRSIAHPVHGRDGGDGGDGGDGDVGDVQPHASSPPAVGQEPDQIDC